MGRILRLTRIIVAAAMMVLSTAAAVECGLLSPAFAAWVEKIQLFPAAMAFAITYFVVWLAATLVFGRIYCSTVCPLGTFQDLCARIPRLRRHRDSRFDYHYRRPSDKVRYTVIAVVLVLLVAGLPLVVSLIDPWCIYSRFCANVLRPALKAIGVCGPFDAALSAVQGDIHLKIAGASMFGLVISVVTMAVVAIISGKSGRLLCNTVCPVGTTLGFVSRNAILHIDINTDKCIQCRKCEHVCKAQCIDLIDHVVDSSRCVVCFDCLPVCPNDAIRYTHERHQLAIPMMQKISGTVAGAGSVNATGNSTATIQEKKSTES